MKFFDAIHYTDQPRLFHLSELATIATGQTATVQLQVSHRVLTQNIFQRYSIICNGQVRGYLSKEGLVFHLRHNLHMPLAQIASLIQELPNGVSARASNVGAMYVRLCQLADVEPYRSRSQQLAAERVRQGATRQDLEDAGLELPDYMTEDATAWFNLVGTSYGHEIEVSALSVSQAHAVLRSLPDIEVQSGTGYTHRVISEWKVVPDGTVSSETVSPVMRGTADFLQVRRVMLGLKRHGARITRACGGHVHFGVEHLTQHDRARIIEAHSAYENMFDSFVSAHRRGAQRFTRPRNRNEAAITAENFVTSYGRYCNDVNGDEVMRGELINNSNRYYHLNVLSYSRYGTFENRQLEGCVNPKKMFAWLCLNFAFIRACQDTSVYASEMQALMTLGETATASQRLDRVAELSLMPAEVKALIQSFMNH
jgi:hypothetical protein